jgi:hypothetical protein
MKKEVSFAKEVTIRVILGVIGGITVGITTGDEKLAFTAVTIIGLLYKVDPQKS